ncbi:MAG: putative rane protein [Acidobacteriota bacterium]|nr:putative rane protein [Acidobacteriota bacterium]
MGRNKQIAGAAACALAGALVAFGGMFSAHAGAQNTNGNMNSNMSGMNHNSNMKMSMSSDAKFMMTAAQGGMAEVAAGRYAVDHASSDAVKQYAQKMVDDHTANNAELMQLAATKGVTLPTTPDMKHQEMMDKMMKMSGTQFDMEYIKNAGVKDHESMEKLMMKESSEGKDADAKAFAAKTLPTVQSHLQMARDMMMSMKNMNMNMHGNMNSNSNMNSNTKSNKKSKGNMNGNMNSNNSNR